MTWFGGWFSLIFSFPIFPIDYNQNNIHMIMVEIYECVSLEKKRPAYLIFPKVEKIVCVTNMDGFDETRGSANHRDGAPLNTIVSGCCLPLPPLEFPDGKYIKPRRRKKGKAIRTQAIYFELQTAISKSIEIFPIFLHSLKIICRRNCNT